MAGFFVDFNWTLKNQGHDENSELSWRWERPFEAA